MNDYIKREDAINAIERTWINGTSLCSADKAEEIIKSLPSADVIERKRGEWINYKDEHQCSVCREYVYGNWEEWYDDIYDFCPNCGCQMNGEKE